MPLQQRNRSPRGRRPADRTPYRGWRQAWARCVSLDYYAQGLDVAPTVRLIREYYPSIRLRYDPQYKKVVVWRDIPGFGWALQFWSPFGLVVDQRLFHITIESDRHRAEVLERELATDENNESERRARVRQLLNQVDSGRLAWGMRREQREIMGRPMGLKSFVPAQIGGAPC